jgi:hypothetical protein
VRVHNPPSTRIRRSLQPPFELNATRHSRTLARFAPILVRTAPMVRVELERVDALELLSMTLAQLGEAERRAEISPRIPLLMTIRDKLAESLAEEK